MSENKNKNKNLSFKIQLALNTEMLPIFSSSFTKLPLPHIYEKKVIVDGKEDVQSVSIGKKNDKSDLNEGEFGVYSFFCHRWNEEGRPWNSDKPDTIKLPFSMNELAMFLDLSPGKTTNEWIEERLLNCSVVPIVFKNSFLISKDKYISGTINTRLIFKYYIHKTEDKEDLFDESGIGRRKSWAILDPTILKNLVDELHKPLLFNVYNSLGKGNTPLIYKYLDRKMTGNTRFHKDLIEFAQEIPINTEVPLPNLKSGISKCLEKLINIPLSGGGAILRAKVVISKSKSGYKVIAIKSKLVNTTEDPNKIKTNISDNQYVKEKMETDHFLAIYNNLSIEEKESVQKRANELLIKENNNPEIIPLPLKNLYIKKILIQDGYTYP